MMELGRLNWKRKLNNEVRGEVDALKGLLNQSRAVLSTASVHFPGMRSQRFRTTVSRLVERQKGLEAELYRFGREPIRDQLGLWPAVIAGGAAILSALGLSVYKQRQETKEVESRMQLYDRLILEGHTTEEAGRMAFDGGGGVTDALNKLIMLAAIAAGLLIYLKAK